MRLEIVLLIICGYTPKQIAQKLGLKYVSQVYHYQDALNEARKRLKEL